MFLKMIQDPWIIFQQNAIRIQKKGNRMLSVRWFTRHLHFFKEEEGYKLL